MLHLVGYTSLILSTNNENLNSHYNYAIFLPHIWVTDKPLQANFVTPFKLIMK